MTDSLPSHSLRIVLVSTRNPLNIGAVARAMSNFGFQHLRVVRPYEAAFREARSAIGAEKLLAQAAQYDTVAEAVADCSLVVGTTAVKQRALRHGLFSLQNAAPRILAACANSTGQKTNVAILFGPEKTGLSNEDLSYCHWLMHIPTDQQQRSMNLGQAVAVCLYELARSSADFEAVPAAQTASAADLERVTDLLSQVLHSSGYLEENHSTMREEALRRMVRRLALSAEDATLLLGMLRQILWKLTSQE